MLDKLELGKYLRILRVFTFSLCRGWWFEGILETNQEKSTMERMTETLFSYRLLFTILVCQTASSAA